MDQPGPPQAFQFGEFRLDRRAGGLFRGAGGGRFTPVSIGSRALDVLGVLAERPGALVSKDEIMAAVWPDTVVEEANLTVQISTLRRVLDLGRPGVSWIQTVPGRGYRFVAPVTWIAADDLTVAPLMAEALGTRTSTLERNDQARGYLEQALRIDPNSVPAMVSLARVIVSRIVLLGDTEKRRTDVARARLLLDQARRREPASFEILLAQAFVLRAEWRFDEALAAYRHLQRIRPDDAGIYNQIAVCSLALGRPEDAVAALTRALELDPAESRLVDQKLSGTMERPQPGDPAGRARLSQRVVVSRRARGMGRGGPAGGSRREVASGAGIAAIDMVTRGGM